MGLKPKQARGRRAAITFGRVLKELRLGAQLSQESLATLAGVKVQQIAKLEKGIADPTLVMIFQLAAALGLEPSALIARLEGKLRSRLTYVIDP